MSQDLACRDDRRRRLDRERGFNGVDYVDVDDDQVTLTVFFLLKAPPDVTPANVRVSGGRRIRDIAVIDVRMCRVEDPDLDDCMIVTVDRPGDFSCYELCLVEPDEHGRPGTEPMQGFDPRYACAGFSFKVNCPSPADCRTEDDCPPPGFDEPEIPYLAKDYLSFRQVILDRLALVMPEWRERHVPDFGIAVVELLAYVGDQLSYHQDAVASEAYLHTARLRTSVRRHARLVDYFLHEGCNARAWVAVEADQDARLPADVAFATGASEVDTDDRVTTWEQLGTASAHQVFAPVEAEEREVWRAHSRIRFHTWGDGECCLPAGATSATLLDPRQPAPVPVEARGAEAPPAPQGHEEEQPPAVEPGLRLRPGDVLILEEVLGPRTGDPADADPEHRHAVMLTRVEAGEDPVTGDAVVEVEWAAEDALPFPLCISAVTAPPACEELADVSVARGNVVLVDHGRPVRGEVLGTVGAESSIEACADDACGAGAAYEPARFRPRLEEQPLTFTRPLAGEASARALQAAPDPRAAVAAVRAASIPLAPGAAGGLFEASDFDVPESLVARLRDPGDEVAQALRRLLAPETIRLLEAEDDEGELSSGLREALLGDLRRLLEAWSAERDLLASDPRDRHFVVEIDNEGAARLRFGDGDLGMRPRAHATFLADYRIGNGPAGNVSAEAITRAVFGRTVVRGAGLRPRNPLAAWGGTAPESITDAKLRAPGAYRRELVRAVVADDYARLAERHAGVQRAAASMRWTGSWPEVHVAIDAVGGTAPAGLLESVREFLEPYRRIGHDVAVVEATPVPLLVELLVCVLPHAQRAHVEADLRRALGSRRLAGGAVGFFHPDALTFGDDVHVSALVARAHTVAGVESVQVLALQRLHGVPGPELDEGVLHLATLEVALMADDPDFPENGRLELRLEGGR